MRSSFCQTRVLQQSYTSSNEHVFDQQLYEAAEPGARLRPVVQRWMTEGNGMTSTRDHLFTGNVNESGRGVVRLRARGGSDEITFDELPIAVGFGSPVGMRPRRLSAVPALPVEFAGGAGSKPGRVIALPIGGMGGRCGTAGVAGLGGSPATGPRSASSRPESVPLRLTARGRLALLVAAAAIGLAVVVSAWFGAGSSTPPARAAQPAQVVVHDGDTLWSIVGRIAPDRDSRAVIDQLLRVNHLDTPALVPGQVLRTR